MPKIVDRDARRREIVETYLRVVARDGMEAASTRALAAELGVSSGALWHYFDGFDEVLFRAFQLIFERTNVRIAASTEAKEGVGALLAMLEELHPLDKVTRDEAYVVTSFWGRVPSKPSLGVFQSRVEERWRADIRDHLADGVRLGELDPAIPFDGVADTLLVLVVGYQVEHVLRTPVAAPERQWRAVDQVLTPWLTELGRASSGLDRREAASDLTG
ncbi:TetR/AcrR family transcriptional regulator [Georgenia halophila]|uniref:TetR/AcrR family transcriptional regulator n=1 Tax=Georgenia halophila TaxID=620889 RepID=A0ABP8LM40_9MICO